jgi:hypothetical protein
VHDRVTDWQVMGYCSKKAKTPWTILKKETTLRIVGAD